MNKKKQNEFQYWLMVYNNMAMIKKHNPKLAEKLAQKIKEK